MILHILGFACLMNLVHETPLYRHVLERFNLDRKPFNCMICSTFWTTFGFTVIPYGVESIFIAGITAILAELLNIQIHKI